MGKPSQVLILRKSGGILIYIIINTPQNKLSSRQWYYLRSVGSRFVKPLVMKCLESLKSQQVGDSGFLTSGALRPGSDNSITDIFASDGEYGRAAKLYDRAGSLKKDEGSPKKAAGSFKKAADAYSLDEQYNEGASVLAREGLFQELVGYLKL